MSNTCGPKAYIFQEAVDHGRWKSALCNNVLTRPELKLDNLHSFKGKNFDEILSDVYNICDKVKGIGILTMYDIVSAICRYNNINIEKIYIIGDGPKRAIRLLNLKAKTQKIEGLTLKYVEIPEVLKAFHENGYEIIPQLKTSRNGDDFESYICNWQKTK